MWKRNKRNPSEGSRLSASIFGVKLDISLRATKDESGRERWRAAIHKGEEELWWDEARNEKDALEKAQTWLYFSTNRFLLRTQEVRAEWEPHYQGGSSGTLYIGGKPCAAMLAGRNRAGQWVALVQQMTLTHKGETRVFPNGKAARRAAKVAATRLVREGRAHLPKDR